MRLPRILIIDDEEAICESLESTLAGRYEVRVALNGREGLAHLTEDAGFDLIVCDCMMPGISGWELFSQVRGRWPALEDRFIFITGGSLPEEFGNGPYRVLQKPFSLRTLRETIAEVLQSLASPAEPVS